MNGSGRDDEGDRYARKRRQQRRHRRRLDAASYDPRPPSDDDWTAPDEDEDSMLHVVRRPRALGELLDLYVQQRRWQPRVKGASVFNRWEQIVGPDLAERCQPVRLAGGTLVVQAENQTWATQLRYMTTVLQQRTNEVLGAEMVRQVRITVGKSSE